MKVSFLDTFAMISLGISETEKAFFKKVASGCQQCPTLVF
jgi:hypothetical protein